MPSPIAFLEVGRVLLLNRIEDKLYLQTNEKNHFNTFSRVEE
jgi:hypothetical protein